MKRIVSISLGSSKRDDEVYVNFMDEAILLKRIGTDGDKDHALQLIRQWRDKVAAFGLGGTDLYIYAGENRYTFRESLEFVKAAGTTPIFDGSGLKNTLEQSVIRNLQRDHIIDFKGTPVLLVCGVDRFGMAKALTAMGSDVVFGDLMFGLHVPVAIKSLTQLNWLAQVVAPVVTKLPIHYFYPIGKAQEVRVPKFIAHFERAKIIAGDFHFIRRYMPETMPGKIVITNTVTKADLDLLKQIGVNLLITTTPSFCGRSFGTNLIEALLVVLARKNGRNDCSYADLLEELKIKPSINYLNLE